MNWWIVGALVIVVALAVGYALLVRRVLGTVDEWERDDQE